MFSTKNVCVEVVANHDGCVLVSARLLKSIFKELRRGFVDTRIFAEDDGVEVVEEPTGMEFLVLHFVESVATHVHVVALVFEVIHQFSGSLNKSRLLGTKRKELVAGFEAVFPYGIESFSETQRVTETFHDEVVTFNLSLGILCPKSDVGVPIVIMEHFRIIES